MAEFHTDDFQGKLRWLQEQARLGVSCPEGDNRRPPEPPRTGPLPGMVPHPGMDGAVEVNWASELARKIVRYELGRPWQNEDEYMECLAQVANEKGWTVTF